MGKSKKAALWVAFFYWAVLQSIIFHNIKKSLGYGHHSFKGLSETGT